MPIMLQNIDEGKYCSKQNTENAVTWSSKAELLFLLKGCRPGLPKTGHFGMRITLSCREWRPCGFTRNFYLSLKQLMFGALPVIRVIARNNFLWSVSRAGQKSHHRTSALTILQMPFLPLKPRAPYLIRSSEVIYTSNFLAEPLRNWGSLDALVDVRFPYARI